jgi:hypothetical protein
LDPEHGAGAKVPDLVGFPTGTVQLIYETVLSSASGGDTIAFAVMPILGDNSAHYPIIQYASATPGTIGTLTTVQWPGWSTISSACDTIRPVSAEIKAEFIGPSTADGGQICGVLLGRNTVCTVGSPGVINLPGGPNTINTYTGLQKQYGTISVPLRDGMRVRWKPQDNNDLEFFNQATYPNATSGDVPTMVIAVNGLPTGGVSYLKVRVICNFELVPNSDTYSIIAAQPSPVIPELVAEALNKVGDEQFCAGPLTNYANLGLTGVGSLPSYAGYGFAAYNTYNYARKFLTPGVGSRRSNYGFGSVGP